MISISELVLILIFWELTVEGRSWICFDSSLAILRWSYKKLDVPETVGYFCGMDSCPVYYHLCSLWTNHLMTSLRTDVFLDYGFITGKLWWIIIRGILACQSTVSKLCNPFCVCVHSSRSTGPTQNSNSSKPCSDYPLSMSQISPQLEFNQPSDHSHIEHIIKIQNPKLLACESRFLDVINLILGLPLMGEQFGSVPM